MRRGRDDQEGPFGELGGLDLAASRKPTKGVSVPEEAAGDFQCRCWREVWEGEGWDEPRGWTARGAGDRWQWLEERVAGETVEMPLYMGSFSLKLCSEGKEIRHALGRGGTSLGERGRRMWSPWSGSFKVLSWMAQAIHPFQLGLHSLVPPAQTLCVKFHSLEAPASLKRVSFGPQGPISLFVSTILPHSHCTYSPPPQELNHLIPSTSSSPVDPTCYNFLSPSSLPLLHKGKAFGWPFKTFLPCF